MTTLLGVSGASRNGCAAVCVDGQIRAVCEQERLTRVRGIGLEPSWIPSEAVDEVLSIANRRRDDVTTYVTAEQQVQLPAALPRVIVDHHHAHAATAFLTSPARSAAVLICDTNGGRELSVWAGNGAHLQDLHWPWQGRGLATLYSECAELFGFARHQEHRLEALAHLAPGNSVDELRTLFQCVDGSLHVERGWRAQVHQMIQAERLARQSEAAETASGVQRRIGELLVELVADIRGACEAETLCVGGGLFYNTYFTTLIRRSGIYSNVFVPINPGNAGLAVGATSMLAHRSAVANAESAVSPFLGPEYDAEAIKTTLDSCKLSYSLETESGALDATVDALRRGQLVGWFQGRMEWGHRALGHRSILANPTSPYVLDNLNCFLRKREKWRAFGVSACADTASDFFCGPSESPYMEYEYGLRDDRLRHVVPAGATSIRVQTIKPEMGLFWSLHKRMEQATGTGVLVNTSFNGFREPIACSPRDAVRVFYGTGLDMLVVGRFILRK